MSAATVDRAAAVGRNAVFRLGAQALSALVNVAGMMLLARALSPNGYGEYAYWYALIPLAATLADAGAGMIVTREMARDPGAAGRWLGDALLLKAALAVLYLVIAAVIALALHDPVAGALTLLVTVTALLDFGQDPAVWSARARERQDLEGVLLLAGQLAWLAGLGLCALLRAPMPAYLAVSTVTFALRAALGWTRVARGVRPVFAPSVARLRALAVTALPFGVALAGSVLYGRIGVLALRALSSAPEVAYFNIGYMLSQPLGFLSSALSIAAFPLLARQAAGDRAVLALALRRTAKAQMVLALPIAVLLYGLAPGVVRLMLPAGFERAAQVLRAMSFAVPFIFLNLTSRYVLTALDRQRHYLAAVAAGVAVNLGLSLALVPRWGASGAAFAVCGSELVVFAVGRLALADLVHVRELVGDALRPLAAAAVTAALLACVPGWTPVPAAAGALSVYAVLLLLSGGLSVTEREVVRRTAASFAPAAIRAAIHRTSTGRAAEGRP